MRLAWLGLLYGCFLSTSVYAVNATLSRSVFYHFKSPEGPTPYLELFWQVDPGSLHFYKTGDTSLVAHIRTDIVLRNEAGIIHEDHYKLDTRPLPGRLALLQNVSDNYRHELGTGLIRIEVTLSEDGFGNAFRYVDSFTLAPAPEQPFFSSFQLVDTSFPGRESVAGPFYRNGMVQLPLAANFLDERRDSLRYYLELYRNGEAQNLPVSASVFISKRKGEAVAYGLKQDITPAPGAVQGLSGSLPINVLPSGNYYLNAVLKDAAGNKLAEQQLFFQRINPNPAKPPETHKDSTVSAPTPDSSGMVSVIDLRKTFVSKYTTAQIKAILKMLLPVADGPERDAIRAFQKTPDDTYMRYFVYNFFSKKNSADPEAEWKKYSDKVRAANKIYSASGKPGYETDRGFIFLKYGEPSERVIARNEPGSLPYEIWVYNTLPKYGRVCHFLFYQPSSINSNYELLHTTVPDEMKNAEWRKFLYPTGQNGNARAEQYIGNR